MTDLVRFELVRLARGGRQPLLRGVVAAVTLAGLFLTYLSAGAGLDTADLLFGGGSLPQSRMARFGETFLVAFLAVQLAAVVLVAPVVMGAAISTEKDRGTLDALLTTGLTPRQIVAGKFLARYLYVVGVAAAGVPVLAMTSIFGGVDLPTLAGGTVVVLVGAASLGAGAVLAAARQPSLAAAVGRTAAWLAGATLAGTCCGFVPGVAALSPVSALVWLLAARGSVADKFVWASVALYAIGHTLYALDCLGRAAAELTAEKPVRAAAADVAEDLFPAPVPVYGVAARPRKSAAPPRPPDRHPPDDEAGVFAWKERAFPGRRRADAADAAATSLLTGVGLVLGLVFVGVLVRDAQRQTWAGDAFTPALQFAAFAAATGLPVLVGVRAAGAVARERDRNTLDALLTLPAGRRDILRAKFRAALAAARAPAALAGGFGVAAAALGGAFPVGLLTAAAVVAAFTAAAAAAGVYLSVRARTVTPPTLGVVAALFLTWVGPVLAAPAVRAGVEAAGLAPDGGPAAAVVTCLSPPVGALRAVVGWPFFRLPAWDALDPPALLGNTLSAAGLSLTAWLAWRAAARRFDRLGR